MVRQVEEERRRRVVEQVGVVHHHGRGRRGHTVGQTPEHRQPVAAGQQVIGHPPGEGAEGDGGRRRRGRDDQCPVGGGAAPVSHQPGLADPGRATHHDHAVRYGASQQVELLVSPRERPGRLVLGATGLHQCANLPTRRGEVGRFDPPVAGAGEALVQLGERHPHQRHDRFDGDARQRGDLVGVEAAHHAA